MKIKELIILLSATAVFYACGNEVNDVTEEGIPVPLSIADASLTAGGTRAATTLSTSGDAIGLFLAAGTPYSATDNVKYSYTTAWAAVSTAIYLTKSTASLCAYYPYVDGATVNHSLASIAYSAASDLCYKSGISASSTASSLSFEMGHAYSKLTLNISKGTYPGTGAISAFSFSNAGLVTSSTLDISTGIYTNDTGADTYTADPGISSLSTTATAQYLMVPCTLSGSTTLTLIVDGLSFVATIPNATLGALVAGSNHTLTITLSGTALVVNSVSTTDWVEASDYLMVTNKTANCYIVAPSSSLEISVGVKGNGDATLASLVGGSVSFTAASVGVLWQTSVGLVSVNDFDASAQTVTVTAGTASGNAVIAAYDTDGTTILWSWHIWVTDYDPDTPSNGTTYNFNPSNPLTFMDRNLGATTTTEATLSTMGLLYQWGRKDPFPGAAAVSQSNNTYTSLPIYNASGTLLTEGSQAGGTGIKSYVTTAASNLANTILHPLWFYCGSPSSNIGYDWYTVTDNRSSQNDALWGNALYTGTPAIKTIFDPCPAGWRVPTWKSSYSPWDVFGTSTLNSYVATSTVGTFNYGLAVTSVSAGYFPAAGGRDPSNGAFFGVGSEGYYWSASSYDGYGFNLGLLSSNVYPALSNDRGYGLSVRCVQE